MNLDGFARLQLFFFSLDTIFWRNVIKTSCITCASYESIASVNSLDISYQKQIQADLQEYDPFLASYTKIIFKN